MIIAKFGGTSMGTASSILTAANIVKSNPQIKIVIVSATSGTTNNLIKLIEDYQNEEILFGLIKKHTQITKELGIEEINDEIKELFLEAQVVTKTLSKGIETENTTYKKHVDRVLSIGERVSSLIFSRLLKTLDQSFSHFDVRIILKTDNHYGAANPLFNHIYHEVEKELLPKLAKSKFVMGGFIGSTIHGNTTTLGRGGSDYTAAIVGNAVNAKLIQIYTDVDGLFTSDPRVIPAAKLISDISFVECFEICQYGAKVLHPKTLMPASLKNIPVEILNTFNQKSNGTKISNHHSLKNPITAITLRKNQKLFVLKNIQKENYGQVLDLFNQFNIAIDLINTSENTMAITLDESMGHIDINPNLIVKLKEKCELSILSDFDLIGIIGRELFTLNIMSLINQAMPYLINFGSYQNTLLMLINKNVSVSLLKDLHQSIWEKS